MGWGSECVMAGTSLMPKILSRPPLQKNSRLSSCLLYGQRPSVMAVCRQPPNPGESIESKRRLNMKSAISKTLARTAGALLVAILVLAAGTIASAQSPDVLVGTWRVQVVQYNCANPSITFPPFYSLLSFHQGGTETETTSNPSLLPGQRTSGHGFWKPLGHSQYLMVVEAFILSNSPTTPPGLQIGTQKIVQAVGVTDPNHFNTNGSVNFFTTSGTNYLTGC